MKRKALHIGDDVALDKFIQGVGRENGIIYRSGNNTYYPTGLLNKGKNYCIIVSVSVDSSRFFQYDEIVNSHHYDLVSIEDFLKELRKKKKVELNFGGFDVIISENNINIDGKVVMSHAEFEEIYKKLQEFKKLG